MFINGVFMSIKRTLLACACLVSITYGGINNNALTLSRYCINNDGVSITDNTDIVWMMLKEEKEFDMQECVDRMMFYLFEWIKQMNVRITRWRLEEIVRNIVTFMFDIDLERQDEPIFKYDVIRELAVAILKNKYSKDGFLYDGIYKIMKFVREKMLEKYNDNAWIRYTEEDILYC